MKDTIKLLLVLLCCGIGAGLPITGFYLFWSWCMATIGTTVAYASLIKVGVTIACVAVGGGATIGLAMLGGVIAGVLAVAILEP